MRACLQANSLKVVETAAWPVAEKHSGGVSSHVIVGLQGAMWRLSQGICFSHQGLSREQEQLGWLRKEVLTPAIRNSTTLNEYEYKGRVRNTRLINAFDDVRLTFMFYLEHLDLFASGFTANKSQNTFHELHSQVRCYYQSRTECKTGSSQKHILNKHVLLLHKVNKQR